MGVDMSLEGMGDILDSLSVMVDNSNKVMVSALEEGAEPILRDAKHTAAFNDRTGRLRQSLKKSKVRNTLTSKGRKVIWVGDVDGVANWSWSVEFGHSKAPAHPFLAPAYERNKNEAYRIIKETLTEALK